MVSRNDMDLRSCVKLFLTSTLCRPTVEKMNEFAPAHSRLFKEVSLVHF